MKPGKDKLHKMTVGKQREKQVEQGFFDGRFVQRAEESKKVFKRKEKLSKKMGNRELISLLFFLVLVLFLQ
jgi:hypothetical protein